MCYSIEPRHGMCVKRYWFLSFAKNIGKKLSSTYSHKLLDSAKKSITDALKAASKTASQKQQKQLVFSLVIADKITSVSNKSTQNKSTCWWIKIIIYK